MAADGRASLRQATVTGWEGKGALPRREGLYSSHIVEWRRARDAAAVEGLSPRVRQPKASPDAAAQAKASRRSQRLVADLAKHKLALDSAGKAQALSEMLPRARRPNKAETVIDACVAALEPLIGTGPAYRAAGKSKATHYRRQLLTVPVAGRPRACSAWMTLNTCGLRAGLS